jgi:tetratricopeptide (TPR) repeat protein
VISAGHEATAAHLAAALHVLAQALLASGRAEESLEAEEECVRIRREIAADLDLAASLVVLGQALTATGRQDAARAAAEEATGLFERLQDTAEAAAQVAEGLAQARTLHAALGPASRDDSQRC